MEIYIAKQKYALNSGEKIVYKVPFLQGCSNEPYLNTPRENMVKSVAIGVYENIDRKKLHNYSKNNQRKIYW